MRTENLDAGQSINDRTMAEIAADYADSAIDARSDYGVGATLAVNFDKPEPDSQRAPSEMYKISDDYKEIYAGCNINISGMEYKLHAEQMAIYQLMMDLAKYNLKQFAEIEKLMVVTTEDDMPHPCGHCLQVLSGVVEWLDQDSDVMILAAKGETLYDDRGNPDGVHWRFNVSNLEELICDTYVSRGDGDGA